MGTAVEVLAPFLGPAQGIAIGRGERPDALNRRHRRRGQRRVEFEPSQHVARQPGAVRRSRRYCASFSGLPG
jgi:hypothetical protein